MNSWNEDAGYTDPDAVMMRGLVTRFEGLRDDYRALRGADDATVAGWVEAHYALTRDLAELTGDDVDLSDAHRDDVAFMVAQMRRMDGGA